MSAAKFGDAKGQVNEKRFDEAVSTWLLNFESFEPGKRQGYYYLSVQRARVLTN